MENYLDYVVKTLDKYPIIGIGEGRHHLENFHIFLRKLLNNQKIQEKLNVIIVEFANAAYQDILDKYLFGEDVPIHELHKVWRESTQSINRFGEASIYFELLKHVRGINFKLARDKKIRVLGGDPPIDWTKIKSLEDYHHVISEKDTFPARLAIEYGLKQNMHVLVIYSEIHLTKMLENKVSNITTYINNQVSEKMKVIAVLDPAAFHLEAQTKDWPLYAIIDLENNELGQLPAGNYFTQLYNKDGQVLLFKNNKINELFDAFLYIGQSDTWRRVDFPKNVFSEKEWRELNRRRQIIGLNSLEDS